MKRLLMVLVTIILVVEGSVLAGPLVWEQVSGGADWVAHTDQQQFKKTRTGQLIRNEMVNLGIEEGLTNFATIFSFHPLDDVRDITIYGTGKDRKKAVILIDGFFNKERILSILRPNPEYEEIKYGDIILHQWYDENQKDPNNKMMYGGFYKDDLIVMGAGLGAVKHGVDVLKGSSENAAKGVFEQASLDAEGAFFKAAGKSIGEMVGQGPHAAVLKHTNQIGLAVGEIEGRFYLDLALTARSEEAAQAITKILDGIIAFVSLQNEEQPMLAKLAKKAKVFCEKSKVKAHLDSDPEAVVQFLKNQWLRNKEKQTQKQ
jgi:hypothetical protein